MLQLLPAQVAERADEALQALFRHPERRLLPWYRHALYVALAEENAGTGRRARAWLDILAVRRVLFCWRPLASGPRHTVRAQPGALLAMAEEVLRGASERGEALAELNHALAYCDVAGELPGSPRYAAWCVYEAAARALESACAAAASPHSPAPSLDDAAGHAAIAVSDDPQPWSADQGQEAEDARLRRAVFWEWWLRQGLPAAVSRAER